MSLSIRRAGARDLDALLALEAAFPGDRLSRRSLRRLLGRPSARIWVADLEEHPVAGGAVLLLRRDTTVARLYSLAVDARHRHRGVARALLHAAEVEAAAAGCRELRLEIRADNAAAMRLYRAAGYRTLRSLPAYYDDGGDGLRLGKGLGNSDERAQD